jgi:hypothetical protein
MKNELDEIIMSSKVVVHKERYAYLKAIKPVKGKHFLVSQDDDEVTIVTEEKNVSSVEFEKSIKWFRLFEISISKPFLAKGFLAKVTKTIAEAGLNILVVSTFSKDYILIKEEDSGKAVDALKSIGFMVAKE